MTAQDRTPEDIASDGTAPCAFGRLRQQPTDRITVGHQTDRGLASLRKTFTRQIEDVRDGDAPALRLRALEIQLRDVEREQALRAALAGSWLAVDGGCDDYTAWIAAGGLPAVIAGSGLPLSYPLAIELDRAMFLAGRVHVLDWPDIENAGSVKAVGSFLEPYSAPGEQTELAVGA